MNFPAALKQLEVLEGGVSNDASDRGGLTNLGITQGTYDDYNNGLGNPLHSVQEITDQEVSDIYTLNYWNPCGAPSLPDGLDFAVFQSAVVNGVGAAVKMLQGVVGATQDGGFGPETLQATRAYIASNGKKALIAAFLNAQSGLFSDIVAGNESQAVFGQGWQNRVTAVADFIEKNSTITLIVLAVLGLGVIGIALAFPQTVKVA